MSRARLRRSNADEVGVKSRIIQLKQNPNEGLKGESEHSVMLPLEIEPAKEETAKEETAKESV